MDRWVGGWVVRWLGAWVQLFGQIPPAWCARVRHQAKGALPAIAAALARQVGTWASLLFSRDGCSCPPSPPPPASFWWASQPINHRAQASAWWCDVLLLLLPASFATCCHHPSESSSPPSSSRRSTTTPALLLVLLVLWLLLAAAASAALCFRACVFCVRASVQWDRACVVAGEADSARGRHHAPAGPVVDGGHHPLPPKHASVC